MWDLVVKVVIVGGWRVVCAEGSVLGMGELADVGVAVAMLLAILVLALGYGVLGLTRRGCTV